MIHIRSAVAAGAPDPDDAVRRFERIAEAAESAGVELRDCSEAARTILAVCCQRAPFLANLLTRDPRRLMRVAGDAYLRREKPAELFTAGLAGFLEQCGAEDRESFDACLRRFRGDELVRLGVRELALGTGSEVGRELAHLADACFDAAIAFHDATLRQQVGAPRYTDDQGVERDAELVVIGMGKLGGEELNFTSDVDVIFVYSSDHGAAGDLTLHEYFCKLCNGVVASIGDYTDDGLVFRVDLRLRPEGSRGPIANSLPSTERYYESWGRPWERQAWLKGRPCAGATALGEEVMAVLRPFIYPRSTSPTVIDEVTNLNRRIKAELDSAGVESGFDLKNGVGGIREIEFFVQALQLIHAGHRPTLRSRNTLVALDQLLFAGLITETEHRALVHAYRFMRHAEHVLQLDSGRQTQRLPAEKNLLELFARRMQCADARELGEKLADHAASVSHLFATLAVEESGPPPRVVALAAGDLPPERELEALAELGFRDPTGAQRDLDSARRKPLSPFSRAATGAAARVAPGLLAEVAVSPDPDQALRYVVDLIGKRGTWSSVWRLFDSNHALMRLIVSLFGTSDFLSKSFVQHPELIDALLQSGRAQARRDPDRLREIFDAALEEVDRRDVEGRWNRLAERKQAQVLRIGLADISGELDFEETSRELSKVADVTLERAFDLVSATLAERHGLPRDEATGERSTMAVLALGKLGAQELGYASDLDLIFVYSAGGESDGERPLDNVTYMTRLAQRLMSGLHTMHPSGRLYEVDARLRPSGTRGLLVSSIAAWDKYHRAPRADDDRPRAEAARLWERQALIKLRPVAGDMTLGARVASSAEEFVYGHAPGRAGRETVAEIAAEISSMRERIERERARPGRHDIKAGRGGLVDVEFATQYLQLVHGHAHPELRTQSTMAALSAAADTGVADSAVCALLADGYRFLRTLDNRMRIVHDSTVQALPTGHGLELLARRAGYPDGSSLEQTYRRWTEEVRRAYARVLENAG